MTPFTVVQLRDRHGALIGFCDVEQQLAKGLPELPEVICLRAAAHCLGETDGRTFVRESPGLERNSAEVLGLGHVSNEDLLPCYVEGTFDWAENFRQTTFYEQGDRGA